MSEQPTVGIYHIRVSMFADPDLRDHIPDELEIDFGNADARVAPRSRECHGDVGLGLDSKIYWAIEDFIGESTDKSRLRGAIDLASHHVYGKARDLQLLPARGVKQRNLGDSWDLAQQAQGLQPALRDAAGVPRHLRGPSHLALDVL